MTSHPPTPLETAARGALWAASWLYGSAVGLRNLAYDRGWAKPAKLPCPVVSVGNLSVGGTGKTTCVEWLVQALHKAGKPVAVLTRGYGVKGRGPYWLRSRGGKLIINDLREADGDQELPDEAQLLAWHLPETPVMVGREREVTGRVAIDKLGARVLILDDGLQYRRLARDCDIVLVSAGMPLGGWPLLPRGPMREPLESLRRADIIIITKADQSLTMLSALQERIRTINKRAVLATAMHEPVALRDPSGAAPPLERLDKARVVLVSSIGDPEGFEQTAKRFGAAVLSHLAYPDHHRYEAGDWREIRRVATEMGAEALLTTAKDWIRLQPCLGAGGAPGSSGVAVWILEIRMQVLTGEDALHARLAAV